MMHSSKLNSKPKPNQTSEWSTFSFEAIGTFWIISFLSFPNLSHPKLKKTITDAIEQFDLTYSRFIANSYTRIIGQRPGIYRLPLDSQPLMDFYETLYRLSGGFFTPLIGKALAEAGYDEHYSLKENAISPVPSWSEALDYNFPYLTINHSIILDFGAAGKGYLADLVAAIFKQYDISSYSINAGGDIVSFNMPANQADIGLENPFNDKEIIAIAHIRNGSFCGSATNRRKWGSFNHYLNPYTTKSVNDVLATWVFAKNGLQADGIASALFFCPAESLLSYFDFEYAIIRQNHSLIFSANFPAEFF